MDALWDCLTGWIDTDIVLKWESHKASKAAIGDNRFHSIMNVLNRMHEQNPEFEIVLD